MEMRRSLMMNSRGDAVVFFFSKGTNEKRRISEKRIVKKFICDNPFYKLFQLTHTHTHATYKIQIVSFAFQMSIADNLMQNIVNTWYCRFVQCTRLNR